MKKLSTCFLLIFIITSCSSLNKVIVNDDTYKNQKNVKMSQALYAKSDDQAGIRLTSYDYIFNVKYSYFMDSTNEEWVKLELKLTTPVRPEILDTIIYFVFGDSDFKLHSVKTYANNYNLSSTTTESSTSEVVKKGENKNSENKEVTTSTTTTTSSSPYQTIQQTFLIPENLFPKFATAYKLKIRAYIGDEGVNIRYKNNEQEALRKFFNKVIVLKQAAG
ncbi:MAG: hypothetical protein JXR31_11310 [Prolixibacteraceae bacterium]|nr:hypothetical protein [Prolixibacteraceae bacterium]MBN2774831.1 hypothetical protein [Prolixibacteraceae bacterium]